MTHSEIMKALFGMWNTAIIEGKAESTVLGETIARLTELSAIAETIERKSNEPN